MNFSLKFTRIISRNYRSRVISVHKTTQPSINTYKNHTLSSITSSQIRKLNPKMCTMNDSYVYVSISELTRYRIGVSWKKVAQPIRRWWVCSCLAPVCFHFSVLKVRICNVILRYVEVFPRTMERSIFRMPFSRFSCLLKVVFPIRFVILCLKVDRFCLYVRF